MGATSIHDRILELDKELEEANERREKELDYVRPELSHLNESWVGLMVDLKLLKKVLI